jgi:histidinol-phosphate aminotransferase
MTQYQICKDIENYTKCIKLDLNEFDFIHHPQIYTSIKNNVSEQKSITHYSNIFNYNTKHLTSLLSSYNNIEPCNLLVSAGSDDSIEYIINKYITKKTSVFIFTPSYNYAEVCMKRKTKKIFNIPLDFNNNSENITDALLFYKEKMTDSVVYIVNPNNPIGTIVSKEHIEIALNAFPNTLFIIDEAYIEFCINLTCSELIKKYNNIIITRTFSKAYGLAGLRLGYLMASQKTTDNVKILYNEKNTTDLAKSAGIAVLENIDYYNNIIQNVIEYREDFQKFLDSLGIYYVPSHGNFVSFYIGDNSEKFLHELEKSDIYIRNRGHLTDMDGFVRITIGNKINMEIVKEKIKSLHYLVDFCPLVKFYTNKNFIWSLKLLFSNIVKVFNNSGIQFWLDGGSLLGFERNSGIIPWDTDIDIGILQDSEQTLLSIENDLNSIGIRLKKNRTNCYYQVDNGFGSDGLIDDLHIDIFLYSPLHGILLNTDPRFTHPELLKCNLKYNIPDLFPLRKIKYYGILDVSVPKRSKKILSENVKNYNKFVRIETNDESFTFPFTKPSYA